MKPLVFTFAALAALAPLAVVVRADSQSDRAELIGSWVQNGGSGGWIIRSLADGVHLTEIGHSGTMADFDCKVDGADHPVQIAGHKATVSLYYNGSALVELETRGKQVVKRSFSALDSGNEMKVEATPMTENARTEETEFTRGQPAGR